MFTSVLLLAVLLGVPSNVSNAEHVLSGINVYGTSVQSLVSTLGKPVYICNLPDDEVPGAGVKVYRWLVSTVQMEVSTHYRTVQGRVVESDVYAVDVWGPEPKGALGVTGAGVSVGGSLADLKKAYGPKFKYDASQTTLQWKDGTQLLVEFDSKGRIFHMQLMAEVE